MTDGSQDFLAMVEECEKIISALLHSEVTLSRPRPTVLSQEIVIRINEQLRRSKQKMELSARSKTSKLW